MLWWRGESQFRGKMTWWICMSRFYMPFIALVQPMVLSTCRALRIEFSFAFADRFPWRATSFTPSPSLILTRSLEHYLKCMHFHWDLRILVYSNLTLNIARCRHPYDHKSFIYHPYYQSQLNFLSSPFPGWGTVSITKRMRNLRREGSARAGIRHALVPKIPILSSMTLITCCKKLLKLGEATRLRPWASCSDHTW